MKISKEVFIILQYYVEQKLIDLLRKSNYLAIHANRVKLLPCDINLILSLQNDVNPYNKNNSLLDMEKDYLEDQLSENADDEIEEDQEEDQEESTEHDEIIAV